jgi:CheY-like chemotaxis protein
MRGRRLAMTLRCVIVDDNPDLLRGASRLLEGQGVAVVGVAENSEQARVLIAKLQLPAERRGPGYRR